MQTEQHQRCIEASEYICKRRIYSRPPWGTPAFCVSSSICSGLGYGGILACPLISPTWPLYLYVRHLNDTEVCNHLSGIITKVIALKHGIFLLNVLAHLSREQFWVNSSTLMGADLLPPPLFLPKVLKYWPGKIRHSAHHDSWSMVPGSWLLVYTLYLPEYVLFVCFSRHFTCC